VLSDMLLISNEVKTLEPAKATVDNNVKRHTGHVYVPVSFTITSQLRPPHMITTRCLCGEMCGTPRAHRKLKHGNKAKLIVVFGGTTLVSIKCFEVVEPQPTHSTSVLVK